VVQLEDFEVCELAHHLWLKLGDNSLAEINYTDLYVTKITSQGNQKGGAEGARGLTCQGGKERRNVGELVPNEGDGSHISEGAKFNGKLHELILGDVQLSEGGKLAEGYTTQGAVRKKEAKRGQRGGSILVGRPLSWFLLSLRTSRFLKLPIPG